MNTDGFHQHQDGAWLNDDKTIGLWSSYDEWLRHMELVTSSFERISARNVIPSVPDVASVKEVTIDGRKYASIYILITMNKIEPTMMDHWRAMPLESTMKQMLDDGTAIHNGDFALTQLVLINDENECGVIACIYPGKNIARMQRL